MERSSGDGAGGSQVFFFCLWSADEVVDHTQSSEKGAKELVTFGGKTLQRAFVLQLHRQFLFYSLVHQYEKRKLKTWDKSISNFGKTLYIAGNKSLAKSEKTKETIALGFSSWHIQSRFQSLALHWLSLSEGSLQHIRSLFCQINLCFKARFPSDRLVILKEQHEHHTYMAWSLSLWHNKDLSFSASDWLTYSFLAHSAGLQYNQWRSALFPTFTGNR